MPGLEPGIQAAPSLAASALNARVKPVHEETRLSGGADRRDEFVPPCAASRLDRARRNERAIEEDVLEHVRRGGAKPIGVGCRAIAQMPVVAIAVVGRIAGYRQEGDALLGDFDPLPLARQEFEAAPVLAIRSHGAIRAAAA